MNSELFLVDSWAVGEDKRIAKCDDPHVELLPDLASSDLLLSGLPEPRLGGYVCI